MEVKALWPETGEQELIISSDQVINGSIFDEFPGSDFPWPCASLSPDAEGIN